MPELRMRIGLDRCTNSRKTYAQMLVRKANGFLAKRRVNMRLKIAEYARWNLGSFPRFQKIVWRKLAKFLTDYGEFQNESEGLAYVRHLHRTVGVGKNDILLGICSHRTFYCMGLDDIKTAFYQIGFSGRLGYVTFLHEIFHAMGVTHSRKRDSMMNLRGRVFGMRVDRKTRGTIEKFFKTKAAL